MELESDQARWAKECCKGGNCPICNPPKKEVCPRCKGKGSRYVQDGPDDVTMEMCDDCEGDGYVH